MLPGTSILDGRFVIETEVATGGMGRVFRARERESGAAVAVKVVRDDDDMIDLARFTREISVLSGLVHPGIVRYLAHGRSPTGRPVLVAEWIDGRSLRDVVARDGLTMAEAVAVGQQVTSALEVVHAQGLVHRDVKPENLLFRDGRLDRLTLIDFGVAVPASGDADARLTLTGSMVGTLGYMSPEQARGESTVDARADLFSLGCVLYECLTARPAFAGEDRAAIRSKLLLVDPVPAGEIVADIPPALDRLLARLLAKERRRRPAGAGEVAGELAALGPLPDAIRRSAALARESPTRRERPRDSHAGATQHRPARGDPERGHT